MTDGPWEVGARGVVELPSGRRVRGRALRRPLPDGPVPHRSLLLAGRQPPPVAWASEWLRWSDFRLPADRDGAVRSVHALWRSAAEERVEVACGGGRGRTGTALAVLAVLDGVPPAQAVAWVRDHYDRRAVETPWQRRYVRRWRR